MAVNSVNSGDQTRRDNHLPVPDDLQMAESLEFQDTERRPGAGEEGDPESLPGSKTDVMNKPIGFVEPESPAALTVASSGINDYLASTHGKVGKALREIKIFEPSVDDQTSSEYAELTQVKRGDLSQTFPSAGVWQDVDLSKIEESFANQTAAAKQANPNEEGTVVKHLSKEGNDFVELTPEQAEALLAEASGEEFPEIEIDEKEMPAIAPIPLEQFILKEKLESHDAYHVFRLLMLHREDPLLWKFLSEKSSNPANFEIFRRNWKKRLVLPPRNKLRPLLSPNFVQSLLITGGVREKIKHPRYGYDVSVFTYSDERNKLGGGQQGEVLHVLFADENAKERKDILVLKAVLLKKALPTEMAQENFERERQIAIYCGKIVENNPEDSRSGHLLTPIYVGTDKIIMPVLRDQNGQSLNLKQIARNNDFRTWTRCLAGAVKGANFASDNGLINSDFKPDNIVNTEAGGVMIDWGGLIRADDVKNGNLILTDLGDGIVWPLRPSGKTPPLTPNYWCGHLMAMELKGDLPAGALHKYMFARIIEKYLITKYAADFDRKQVKEVVPENKKDVPFGKLPDNIKLNYPPLQIPTEAVLPEEKLLYELYLKLHQSHRHPFRFKNNDTKQGIDPDYISLSEIVDRLEEISNLPSNEPDTQPTK